MVHFHALHQLNLILVVHLDLKVVVASSTFLIFVYAGGSLHTAGTTWHVLGVLLSCQPLQCLVQVVELALLFIFYRSQMRRTLVNAAIRA